MDQTLLRSYLATVYELPTPNGPVRASLDGDIVNDPSTLPELLTRPFAILTAYNPRSMLLPRKVNDSRHMVLRDPLILGRYRVESCVGYEEDPEWGVPRAFVARARHGSRRGRLRAAVRRTPSSFARTRGPRSSSPIRRSTTSARPSSSATGASARGQRAASAILKSPNRSRRATQGVWRISEIDATRRLTSSMSSGELERTVTVAIGLLVGERREHRAGGELCGSAVSRRTSDRRLGIEGETARNSRARS